MTISTLDQLIIDTAAEVFDAAALPVRVIFDDPSGALAGWTFELLGNDAGGLAVCASRDLRQVARFESEAARLGVADRAVTMRTLAVEPGEGMLDELFERAMDVTGAVAGAIAVGHAPKALAELDFISRAMAVAAGKALVLGENNKHLNRSMNETLEHAWNQVRASRGRGKFRCLIAEDSLLGVKPARMTTSKGEDGHVYGIGGVFSGSKPDAGGDLLAQTYLRDAARGGAGTGDGATSGGAVAEGTTTSGSKATRVLDLGCGNGSVALTVLTHAPVQVTATDVDADAVAASSRTLANFVSEGRADVVWDDSGHSLAPASFNAVLLNPPFHDGTRVDATIVDELVEAARELLVPGGALYLVHNSHLRYRHLLEEWSGDVRELARDRRFTVLRAIR